MLNMRLKIIFVFLMLLCLSEGVRAFTVLPADTIWRLEKDKNGVKVYTRPVEGMTIKEFKAVVIINAPVSKLLSMVMDVVAYPKWVANVKSVKILKETGNDEVIYYTEIQVPWPLSNRDNIIRSKIVNDSATGIVKVIMTGKPDYLPEYSGIVRIPNAGGYWHFSPLEDGKVEVVMQYLADPAGNIPDWVVNMFVVDGPYKTFLKMREIAEEKE
jgi:uncharacterized membrane protein